MQSLPDTRQQSFDEIYGPPENFLEIEVSSSLTPSVGSLYHMDGPATLGRTSILDNGHQYKYTRQGPTDVFTLE